MSDDSVMMLPEGETCANCGHFERCEFLGTAKLTNVKCDWAPHRFVKAVFAHTSDGSDADGYHQRPKPSQTDTPAKDEAPDVTD